MVLFHKLVRILDQMESEIAEAARAVIQEQNLPSEDVSRSQFKLAVEAAQQAEDLGTLKAFLAYQASRDARHDRNDDKVWGHRSGNKFLVQRAWDQLQGQVDAFPRKVKAQTKEEWKYTTDDNGPLLQKQVAERFFAHLERAFEISRDSEVWNFYCGKPEPSAEAGVPPAPEGGGQDDQGNE